ncbi:class I SAM-dependent methyltransferase [Candidatus Fermentibacterales bacterium]|nr:class I SAM-dependent methyltransferase [Candidatus Fermentibacterales bacterium]
MQGKRSYPGFVAEFYDRVPSYQDRGDVDFYLEEAVATGGDVLELGCGTGRVAAATALAGRRVTGLDISPSMLKVFRDRIGSMPEDAASRIDLVEGDMRRFELGRKFGLITTPFRSFQHLLTTEDQMSCLACVRAHLEERGRFVLDLFNPSVPRLADERTRREYGEEPEFEMPDGRRVQRAFRNDSVDFEHQVLNAEIIYYVTHPDGRRERLVDAFPLRYLFRFEAEHLLARCGFEVLSLYSDYDRSPPGSRYPGELVFVCCPDSAPDRS